ncbi:MAG: alpha/beta fold hydrolase [Actinomycetia bacterium]|nr:alpha/beta fold hydrolase [Actinomycetes bacterium]
MSNEVPGRRPTRVVRITRFVITLLVILLLMVCASEATETPGTAGTVEPPRATDTTKALGPVNTPQTVGAVDTTEPPKPPGPEPTFPFDEYVLTYLEYKPGTVMEIMQTQATGPAPCVMILHGYRVETTFYFPLAQAVAGRDAVVFMPDWNDTLPSDDDPRTTTVTDGLDDIADAIRFIRLYAGRYGADAERIVVVGHSLGAVVGMTTMLAGDQFGTEAFPREVSALPDAYVSLDGVVPFRELLWDADLRRLYDEDPGTWGKINPDTYLRAAGARAGVEFRFFVATLDFAETQSMAERMSELGYKTSVERIDVDHMQAAEPQPETVEAIAELAHAR